MAGPTARKKKAESALSRALVWKGVAIDDPDHMIWGASPLFAAGKYHLFAARWPEKNVDPAWRKSSEIAHYISDRPESPFRFRKVIVKGTGKVGDWDAFGPHNPEVKQFGDSFAFCYIANSDYHQPPHPGNQQIGMLIAKSIEGPWEKVGKNGLILSPSSDPKHFSYGHFVTNPTLLQVGNRFHLYYKTQVGKSPAYALAIVDKLTGPYRMLDEPLNANGAVIEDGSAFAWDGKICLLTTDNHGDVTGTRGGGALWVSDDGIHFKSEWTQLGYDRIPRYFNDYNSAKIKKVYGSDPKFERPKILCLDGKPAWLYATSGWNITGGQRTVSHVLKIELKAGDGPLSGLNLPKPGRMDKPK